MEPETGSPSDVLDKQQLAALLGYSVSWIEQRMRERRFPIPTLSGLGKKPRWSRQSVERYLAGRR